MSSRLGTRHVQCLAVFFGLATAYSVRVNLSLAIVAMTPKLNETGPPTQPILPWTEWMQGSILSSFFWGYLLFQIPGGQMAEKFGPKFLLVTAMLCSGIITALTPFVAIHGGFYWMLFLRALLGVFQGLIPPTCITFLSKWAPTSERGRLTAFVLSGNRFGTLVTPAYAGILAESQWGWPSIFYVTGGMAILWALFFCYVGSSSPQDHKTISKSENLYILNSLPSISLNQEVQKTPWKAILTSMPVWALIVAMFVDHWGFFTLFTQLPRYINGVFGINIKNSGFLSALPYAASFLLSLVLSGINDALINKKILSRTASLKMWNSVASWGPALCLCCLAFSGTNETLALFLLVCSITINTAAYLGIFSNHIELTPNFAGTLKGITQELSLTASIAAPIYVGYIVTDRASVAQWRIIFLTSAALYFIGNLIFIVFGTAAVQSWNSPPEIERSTLAESSEEEAGKNRRQPNSNIRAES